MMLPPITPQTLQIDRMGSAAELLEKRRSDEALQGLEAMFINLMLQEMRKTVPVDEGILGNSAGLKTMETMMDEFMAQELAKSGQLGIARQAMQQIEQQKGINAIEPENTLEPLLGPKVENR